nr:uncharacterized protein LOC127340201 [Lolium perenne]
MVKKKNSTIAASVASSGAASKTSPNPPRRGAPDAAPPAPAPPAPSSSTAGPNPGDWPASTATKRNEKKARSLGLISFEEGNTLTAPEDLRGLSIDTSEGRDSSAPTGFHTEENASPKDERDDPINSKADFINPPSPANDISDTAESMHDDEADHAAFVDAAVEEAKALPAKRPSGGFADEDDLFDLDECLIEPPLKKVKSSTVPAASEASAPAAAPTAQLSTASSLSKGKHIPSAAAAPSSGKPDLRAVISSLEAFASQYTSLEAYKARLQEEVKYSSSKLEGPTRIAAKARQEVDSLKRELEGLKKRLKDEEASRLSAEAWAIERDDLLRQSSLALLEAADIGVEALDKLPNNSPANALSMTLASHQLTQDLLQKGKGAMAWMHSMIFPKINQEKTLGQLIDAFAINTKEVIEVFPVHAFVDDSSGAVSESDRLQRRKDRIAQMKKDLRRPPKV